MNAYKFMGISKHYCNLPGCKVRIEDYKMWQAGEPTFYQFCCSNHKRRFARLLRNIEKYREEYKLVKKKHEN